MDTNIRRGPRITVSPGALAAMMTALTKAGSGAENREQRNAEQDAYESLSEHLQRRVADLNAVRSAPLIRRWLAQSTAPVAHATPREHRPSTRPDGVNAERGPPRPTEPERPAWAEPAIEWPTCQHCGARCPSDLHLRRHQLYQCCGRWGEWGAA